MVHFLGPPACWGVWLAVKLSTAYSLKGPLLRNQIDLLYTVAPLSYGQTNPDWTAFPSVYIECFSFAPDNGLNTTPHYETFTYRCLSHA